MASFWKKGPSWYMRPKGGRPICLGPMPEWRVKELKVKQERLEARAGIGRSQRLAPGLRPIGELLQTWLAEKSDRRPASARCYRTHVNHLDAAFGPIRIGELEAEHVSAYMNRRASETSRRTADKERRTLVAILDWAIARGESERNPARAVAPFAAPPEKRERCPEDLFPRVVAALRVEASKGVRSDTRAIAALAADVIEVMWWTGLRLIEACRLKVADVNLEDPRKSADPRAQTLTVRSPRNKGGTKAIPIPPQVLAIFRGRAADRDPEGLVFGLGLAGPALARPRRVPSRTGSLDPDDAYEALRQFRQRWCARFPGHRPGFFHSLRHALASDLDATNEDARRIMALTRHRSEAVLESYVTRELADLRRVQRKLAKRRSRARGSRRTRKPS